VTKDFCGSVRVGTTAASAGDTVLSEAADALKIVNAEREIKSRFFIFTPLLLLNVLMITLIGRLVNR
jgi:hypothetical protein